jgi:two-component system, OmpR family, sensor kinase
MKTNSIFFKIRIAFAISSFLILAVFAMFYFIQEHYKSMELRERLMHAAKAAKHIAEDPADMNERLHGLELEVMGEEASNALLLDSGKKELHIPGPAKLFLLEKDGKKYIIIMHPKGIAVFLDKKPIAPTPLLLFAALFAVLGVLAVFYRSILQGLTPLEELKSKVEKFAVSGEFDKGDKPLCDELEALTIAFDNTTKHLNNISKARSLFLRNIAHELKTPLSKGRFLAEMVQDEKLQERFHSLFVHFDTLINELLQVERLTAAGMPLDKKEYGLQDCIDEALELAFVDEGQIEVGESQIRICADFKLFTLALKNLISNAIKYSTDGKAKLQVEGSLVMISNTGEPLPRPLEQLTQPFVKGDESSEGLGLGLYIVRQILDAHGAKLEYRYNGGIHSFFIELGNISCKS